MSLNTLDITPTPRILRTLGEIPFQTWQCIAELVDNSIDAFLSNTGLEDREQRITVTWSSDSVGAADRTLEVSDNAAGMSIDQLQNAVRAGYTSNDPIGNLGLFGMGFNIATARLGEETTILSTRSGDADWVGVKIDFQKLIDSKNSMLRLFGRQNPTRRKTAHGLPYLSSRLVSWESCRTRNQKSGSASN